MVPVRIMTDSSAYLDAACVAQNQITVLPVEMKFGEKRFVIGPDYDKTELFQFLSAGPAQPASATVPQKAFEEAFDRLNRVTDDILVLTSSSKLSGAHANAQRAARGFMGRCRITVMDSMSTSWALGLVVRTAAETATKGHSLEAIVRLVRGLLPHLYVVFYLERLDFLELGGRIGVAQALLGTILRIKPILLLEEGEIVPLEKVRTRAAAIDKLSDFVAEFARVQDVVILSSSVNGSTSDALEELSGQLGEVVPGGAFPIIQYDPVMACHLGPEAVGVTVFEGL
ncbi:DegV family protein [Chloroflexota bacterium]